MEKCVSGKRIYPTREVAEDVLIESWTRYDYSTGNGPVSVYQCEDCGRFHLTSKGPMNERLSEAIRQGSVARQKEANRWEHKLKRR